MKDGINDLLGKTVLGVLSMFFLLGAPLQANPPESANSTTADVSVEDESRVKKVDLAKIESVLKEIRGEYRWKGKISSPSDEFFKSVGPKFDQWHALLSQLSSANQRAEADRVCAAIVALRNHWGPGIFPLVKFNAFARDSFAIRDLHIEAAQFFEPVPYYSGDDSIMKLYRFTVYRDKTVVGRYFLEYSNVAGSLYVLGYSDSTKHRQVQGYGAKLPTYWVLKDRVEQDLRSPRTD